MEYNSNFELDEAKSILPPADGELHLVQEKTQTQNYYSKQRLCVKSMTPDQGQEQVQSLHKTKMKTRTKSVPQERLGSGGTTQRTRAVLFWLSSSWWSDLTTLSFGATRCSYLSNWQREVDLKIMENFFAGEKNQKIFTKVNCMAVADAELGAPLRLPIELLEAGR